MAFEPEVKISQPGGSSSGSPTGPAEWAGTAYTPTFGTRLLAFVWASRLDTGNSAVSVTNWALQDSITPLLVFNNPRRVFDARLYERTGNGGPDDDFNPTVGSDWYAGGRDWQCRAIALDGAVGPYSDPPKKQTRAENESGTTFTPLAISPTRGSSTGVIVGLSRGGALTISSPGTWQQADLGVTGLNPNGRVAWNRQPTVFGNFPLVTFNCSVASVFWRFAVSGFGVADWGVDRINW